MKPFIFSIFIILGVFAFGQKRIIGNGETANITRSLNSNFKGIELYGSFDLEIYGGKQDGEISIQADSNLIEHIVTEVKNGILFIQFEKGKSFSTKEDIKISLYSNQLESISLFGSGDIEIKGTQNVSNFQASINGSGDIEADVKAQNVKLSISGSGDIEISGTTKNLEIVSKGSGDIEAFKLKAENVNIQQTGSGDTEVYCNQSLTVVSKGSGDIKYKGNPMKINEKTKGSGRLYNSN